MRVVTQTKSEAEAICGFVREHFEIDEKNSLDALNRLGAKEFGYRSVHYIVTGLQRPAVKQGPRFLTLALSLIHI